MTNQEIFEKWPDKYDIWFETPLGKHLKTTARHAQEKGIYEQQGKISCNHGLWHT
jgi:hypothetical protein